MKLLSFNIGIKINNAKEVAEFVKKQKVDFVAFQEIIRAFEETVLEQYQSQKIINTFLKQSLPFHFFGPQWISNKILINEKIKTDFGGLIEQGNEILSKYPILEARNEFFHQHYSQKTDWTDFHETDHPRCIQIIETRIQEKPLQIINLHGTYSKNKQDSLRSKKQTKQLLEMASKKNIPTIIVGDFNLHPETESIQKISEKYTNLLQEYAITSTRPKESKKQGVVDYIFVSEEIKVNSFEVLETPISDHLPLLLDFEIRT